MSSSFFVFNPFSYDSTPIDVPQEEKENQAHENFSALGPKDNKVNIMGDVDRDMMAGVLFINGINALDLRKQDKLTTVQLEIHNMSDEEISGVSLAEINALMARHSKEPKIGDKEKKEIDEMVSHILTLPEENARKILKSYKESLKQRLRFDYTGENAEKSFTEYTEFLSKYLLCSIPDKEERAFLAKTIASNSHQTGFTKAASAQYKTKADKEFKGAQQHEHSLIEASVAPPKSICHMECKNRIVSFKEDALFQKITSFKDYERKEFPMGTERKAVYYNPLKIVSHEKKGDDYFAHVRSIICIKAEKTTPGPASKFDKIDLSGDRVFISLKKDNKDAYKLFSRVFVDPRRLWQKIRDALVEKITRRKNKFPDPAKPSQEFKKKG